MVPYLTLVALLAFVAGHTTFAGTSQQQLHDLGETKVYSTLEYQGKSLSKDHPVLSQLEHYELHDFSVFLRERGNRRRLGVATEEERLQLNALGRELQLSIKPMKNLYTKNFRHVFVDLQGKPIMTEGALDCVHLAEAEGYRGAVAFCNDDEIIGSFFGSSKESLGIEPVKIRRTPEGEEESLHVIYTKQDIEPNDVLHFNAEELSEASRHLEETRATPFNNPFSDLYQDPIPPPVFTNSPIKYIGVLVVNDYELYRTYKDNIAIISTQVIAAANAYYVGIPNTATYKAVIQLAGMVTLSAGNPFTKPFDAQGKLLHEQLLSVFTAWKNSANLQADVVMLMCGTTFGGEVGGRAYLGEVCHATRNTLEIDATLSAASKAILAAHEIGHSLGMEHDSVDVDTLGFNCDSNPGVMAGPAQRRLQGSRRLQESRSLASSQFTQCSLEWMRLKFMVGSLKYNTTDYPACAESADYTFHDGNTQECGNGLLEGNERCDCPLNNCTGIDACCDGATCQLIPGATCAAQDGCCDPNTCNSAKGAGSICRTAQNECDVQETCDGIATTCPTDVTLIGSTCTIPFSGGAQGKCTCEGCFSLDYYCSSQNPLYVGCEPFPGFECEMENSCGFTPFDVSCFSDKNNFVRTGQGCGTGLGCMNKACVPFNQIVCPWMLPSQRQVAAVGTDTPSSSPSTTSPSKSPTKLEATRSPTASPITSKPTESPSKSSATTAPSSSPTTAKPTKSPSESSATTTPSTNPTTAKPTGSPSKTPSAHLPSSRPTSSPIPFPPLK